jgi:hypothetical protein
MLGLQVLEVTGVVGKAGVAGMGFQVAVVVEKDFQVGT